MSNAVLKQVNAQTAGLLPILHRIEPQHGGQLFIGQGISLANALLLANQHSGAFRNRDAGALGNYLRGASHEFGVHAVPILKQQAAYLFSFFFCHEIPALCL